MYHVKSIVASTLLLFSLFTISMAITGRVVNQSGSAVSNAYITYTDLSHRLIWAYSDGNGNFTLYGPGGTDKKIHRTDALRSALRLQVSGNTIFFFPEALKADVSVYTITGREIAKLLDGYQNAGNGRI